jgi:ubiquitin carboxyl-terminal hydrolase 9/24
MDLSPKNSSNERNEYNIQIFRHIQWIFGHLLESKLQFYIPRGFWKIFKYVKEETNLIIGLFLFIKIDFLVNR